MSSQGRCYSTRELQAAAAALATGQFAPGRRATGAVIEVSSAEPGAAPHIEAGLTAGTGRCDAAPNPLRKHLGTLMRVRAANAGAGASTVALALAEAASGAGIRTRVLDAAAPAWSGLVGASGIELGARQGWRRGRRFGGVLIDRVEVPVLTAGVVPMPRDADGIDLTVLDTGWTARELDAATADSRVNPQGCWIGAAPADVEVVVTRPHTLALGQAEAVLAALDETPTVVVMVGGRSGSVFAAAGPRLRRQHEHHNVVFVPLLPDKALPGLGPEALPKQLLSSAQRLLDRITTFTGPLLSTSQGQIEENPTTC